MSEPTIVQDAVSGLMQFHQRKAICAEMDSVQLQGMLLSAKLPLGQHAIGTKWVFKIERKADGFIRKHKARMIAKGFKQKYGIE